MKDLKGIPDYFDLSRGSVIKVATRFLEDGSYYIYKGTLHRKGKDFVYLHDCEAVRILKGQEIEKAQIKRIALNKSIISWVDFG